METRLAAGLARLRGQMVEEVVAALAAEPRRLLGELLAAAALQPSGKVGEGRPRVGWDLGSAVCMVGV